MTQHGTAQHKTPQHSTAQDTTAQHRTRHHSTAQHKTPQHSTAQDTTAQHSTRHHSTAQHKTPQHSTAQDTTAQHSTKHHSTAQHGTVLCKYVLQDALWGFLTCVPLSCSLRAPMETFLNCRPNVNLPIDGAAGHAESLQTFERGPLDRAAGEAACVPSYPASTHGHCLLHAMVHCPLTGDCDVPFVDIAGGIF